MAKYKALNWAIVSAPLNKILLTNLIVNIKYSKQLGKLLAAVLEGIDLI
jgi:hypothetical protein